MGQKGRAGGGGLSPPFPAQTRGRLRLQQEIWVLTLSLAHQGPTVPLQAPTERGLDLTPQGPLALLATCQPQRPHQAPALSQERCWAQWQSWEQNQPLPCPLGSNGDQAGHSTVRTLYMW